jgi:hypothetical protein
MTKHNSKQIRSIHDMLWVSLHAIFDGYFQFRSSQIVFYLNSHKQTPFAPLFFWYQTAYSTDPSVSIPARNSYCKPFPVFFVPYFGIFS